MFVLIAGRFWTGEADLEGWVLFPSRNQNSSVVMKPNIRPRTIFSGKSLFIIGRLSLRLQHRPPISVVNQLRNQRGYGGGGDFLSVPSYEVSQLLLLDMTVPAI